MKNGREWGGGEKSAEEKRHAKFPSMSRAKNSFSNPNACVIIDSYKKRP